VQLADGVANGQDRCECWFAILGVQPVSRVSGDEREDSLVVSSKWCVRYEGWGTLYVK
jgi:hypothetical protein